MDIVDRLNEYAVNDKPFSKRHFLKVAANEITALRNQLAECKQIAGNQSKLAAEMLIERDIALVKLDECKKDAERYSLSDEEIDELILKKGHLDCILDYSPNHDDISILKFELRRIARAIEKAMSEKG